MYKDKGGRERERERTLTFQSSIKTSRPRENKVDGQIEQATLPREAQYIDKHFRQGPAVSDAKIEFT